MQISNKNTIEVETRTEEVRKTREKMSQDGKLTPPYASKPFSGADSSYWNDSPQAQSNVESVRQAKLAQSMVDEDEDPSLLDEQPSEPNLTENSSAEESGELKQDG